MRLPAIKRVDRLVDLNAQVARRMPRVLVRNIAKINLLGLIKHLL